MSIRTAVTRMAKVALGRLPKATIDIQGLQTEFLGSGYGGWEVWTKPLSADSVVYSFGIGLDNSWDLAMIQRLGCEVFAFDPTPGLGPMLAEKNQPEKFRFFPWGLANFDGEIEMRPLDPGGHSSSTIVGRDIAAADSKGEPVSVKRLATIMQELGHTRLDLLKIDIEGAEFDAVPEILSSGIEIDQFLLEIHPMFSGGVPKSQHCLDLMKQHGYRLFDVSERHLEYGYVHERLVK